MKSSRVARVSSPFNAGLARLRSTFKGTVLLPGDLGYDDARRIWNGMCDRRPALIARCLGTADVSAAVLFARAADLPVTIRGGGHNVAGTAIADDSVMIDLSLMRNVTVNVDEQVAEADGGCLLRDLDITTTAYGLACPAGMVSHTGLGGLALGGGYGWRCRKWGLTCDHIICAEVVLADGSVVEAGEDNPDLLWALRGGGGNFGVVTRFKLRLHRVGAILFRNGIYAEDTAAAALEEYRKFTEKQPDDIHVLGSLRYASDADWVLPELRGTPALDLAIVCSADDAESVHQSTRLFDAVPPASSIERTISYFDLQSMADSGAPAGRRYYTKSCYIVDLVDHVAECLAGAARRNPSSLSSIDIEYLRGAISEEADGQSSFPLRDAPYMCTAWASWIEPRHDAENIAWSRRTVEDLRDWQHQGGYVNYMLQDDPTDVVAEIYGSANYDRLTQVKRRYDPQNVFRTYRNVLPASS